MRMRNDEIAVQLGGEKDTESSWVAILFPGNLQCLSCTVNLRRARGGGWVSCLVSPDGDQSEGASTVVKLQKHMTNCSHVLLT